MSTNMLEAAWGIIANAGGGNWDTQTPEWVAAAERWRDDWMANAAAVPVAQEVADSPVPTLTAGQQIRLETARMLLSASDRADATIGAFVRDMLRLAAAIETGADPE